MAAAVGGISLLLALQILQTQAIVGCGDVREEGRDDQDDAEYLKELRTSRLDTNAGGPERGTYSSRAQTHPECVQRTFEGHCYLH